MNGKLFVQEYDLNEKNENRLCLCAHECVHFFVISLTSIFLSPLLRSYSPCLLSSASTKIYCFIINNTLIFCPTFNCVGNAVDNLSNSWKNNFFKFHVDKTYTVVVYLSTR